jgi:hypothetical protein
MVSNETIRCEAPSKDLPKPIILMQEIEALSPMLGSLRLACGVHNPIPRRRQNTEIVASVIFSLLLYFSCGAAPNLLRLALDENHRPFIRNS